MPRRRKPFVGPGKTLVNGRRANLPDNVDFDAEDGSVDVTDAVELDVENLRKKIEAHVQQFDELALLIDCARFVDDLVDECAWARTQRLDYLVRGARTKPDEWTAQIFASGVAKVMRRHGLKPTITEYDDSNEIRQSLWLRLIPGLSRIAGFRVPKDVKSHALRAKRIKRNG